MAPSAGRDWRQGRGWGEEERQQSQQAEAGESEFDAQVCH